jgi:hypothetical protein
VADKDITDLEVRLPFQAEVSGRVVLEGGGSINIPSGFGVEGRYASTSFATTFRPDGSFRFRLPDGLYQIGVRGLPLGYTIKAISMGDVNLLAAPLRITPGSALSNVVVTLAAVPLESIQGVKVSGQITGATAASLAGTRVGLNGMDLGSHTIESIPNADGTFEFPKVPPGFYTARLTGLVSAGIGPPQRLSVGTDNIAGLQIPVEIRNVISGTVTVLDASGAVVPGFPANVQVTFRRNSGATGAIIRADGTFTMPLVEGEHTISFDRLPAGYTVKSVVSGSADLLKSPLKVERGVTPPPVQAIWS